MTGIPVVADLSPIAASDEVQITIYRIMQESLTNIVKYASATQVKVDLRNDEVKVWLTVSDNGVGFDPTIPRIRRHGLIGRRFRVNALGGELQINSRAGEGTCITAWVPASVGLDNPAMASSETASSRMTGPVIQAI